MKKKLCKIHGTMKNHMGAYCFRCIEKQCLPKMKLTPDDLKSLVPLFFEDEFKKGHEDRGIAIVAIALFIGWLKNHVKELK